MKSEKQKGNNSIAIDLYFKLIERKVTLLLELNRIDEAICEIEEGLAVLKERHIVSDMQWRRFAMLYTNFGIAFESKYEDEVLGEKKEEYYEKAYKYIKNGIKLWKKFTDVYNVSVAKVHLADLCLNNDHNIASWYKKYRRILKEIKGIETNTYQLLYAEMLLRMVNQYCSTDTFNDCGMSYRTAKKYLCEINEIYGEFCPNDAIAQLGYLKTYLALELSHSIEAQDCQMIIKKLDKLIHNYETHVKQDLGENLFELYVNDIQNNLGVAYYRLGCKYATLNNNKAADFLNKSIHYFQESINSYNIINAQGSELLFKVIVNLTNTRLMLYKCDKNKKHLEENIKLIRRSLSKFSRIVPNSLIMAEAYISLGKSYGKLNDFKDEIKFYDKAEAYVCEKGISDDTSQLLYWLYKGYANSYASQRKFEEAREYYNKTKNILLEAGYTNDSDVVMEIIDELNKIKNY